MTGPFQRHPTARWRVIFQEPKEDLDIRTGRFATIMEVTYEVIDTGTVGYVRIPINAYTAERVAQEIQPRADEILAVANLGRE